jgi:DNA-binding response OmpR family regulator
MASIVVVVDADEAERRSIASTLAADGFSLTQVESLVEGLVQALETNVELVVIAEDKGPMGIDEVLPVYRRVTRAPLLVIGDGGGPGEDVLLDRGADFFLPRPFRPSELAVRARVLIQRGPGPRRERRDFPTGSLPSRPHETVAPTIDVITSDRSANEAA